MGSDHSIIKQVIFFDGVCNLCNSSVQFVLKRDKDKKFFFASLQSDYARKNLPEALIKENSLQSIVLKRGDEIKVKSTAVLTITKSLSGFWSLLYVFLIIPSFIRDGIYDLVARYRYKLFGKKDQCMIPSTELRSRFIE